MESSPAPFTFECGTHQADPRNASTERNRHNWGIPGVARLAQLRFAGRLASAEESAHSPLGNGIQAGVGPEEVQVCELHDCFTANELLTYESLGPHHGGNGLRVHL